ncbi:hypothetical protein Hanom_Chr15g01346781 [Helianthus anomalus]
MQRLPVGVSNRAGFTKKLHTLKIENMQGQVSTYEVKPEKKRKCITLFSHRLACIYGGK